MRHVYVTIWTNYMIDLTNPYTYIFPIKIHIKKSSPVTYLCLSPSLYVYEWMNDGDDEMVWGKSWLESRGTFELSHRGGFMGMG